MIECLQTGLYYINSITTRGRRVCGLFFALKSASICACLCVTARRQVICGSFSSFSSFRAFRACPACPVEYEVDSSGVAPEDGTGVISGHFSVPKSASICEICGLFCVFCAFLRLTYLLYLLLSTAYYISL